MSSLEPQGPLTLVTVNKDQPRAFRIIGRAADILKDRFIIKHVANCKEIPEVEAKVREHQPDMLFCASMWTAEESSRAIEAAKSIIPGIRTHVVPQGLGKRTDEDGVVRYIVEATAELLSRTD